MIFIHLLVQCFFVTIIGALYQQSFIFNLVLKGVWIFGGSTYDPWLLVRDLNPL